MKFFYVFWVILALLNIGSALKADENSRPLKVTYKTLPARVVYEGGYSNGGWSTTYLPDKQFSWETADVDADWGKAKIVISETGEFLEVPLRNALSKTVTFETARNLSINDEPLIEKRNLRLVSNPLRVFLPRGTRLNDLVNAALAGHHVECTISDYWFEMVVTPVSVGGIQWTGWSSDTRRKD